MESNLKRIRIENGEIDRISDLPDSILCQILSYLPTKNAIGVSILSTRWKTLNPFEVLPITLNLDDSLLLNPSEENFDSPNGSFMDFVDKLLNQTLSDVPLVERVVLKCEKNYGDDKIVSWVCAALLLNVQHLDLKLCGSESTTLFHSFNGCTTLTSLELSLESELWNEFHVPDDFSLPNLKSLHLVKLELIDEVTDPIEQLVQGCPALEYLYLVQCRLRQCFDARITSPLLKTLVLENSCEEFSGGLVIDAPNLEVLVYNNFLADNYYVGNFNSLHKAHIDIGPSERLLELAEDSDDEDLSYIDDAAMVVSRCSSTTHLYLSERTIDVLNLSCKPLPVFQSLVWLSLGCLHWAVLARLLSITPNLEKLIIEEEFYINEEGFAIFKNLLPFPPECFVLHLKRIEFWVFEGYEDEIKLVEYFLKNGEVLQNITLRYLPLDDTSIFTRLLMFPRRSQTCQIECTWK